MTILLRRCSYTFDCSGRHTDARTGLLVLPELGDVAAEGSGWVTKESSLVSVAG